MRYTTVLVLVSSSSANVLVLLASARGVAWKNVHWPWSEAGPVGRLQIGS
jgi:hypothetical protein